MTDAMQVLFLYAQEHMVCSLLSQEHEYANVRLCVEKQGEAFRALLDETTRERFDNLLVLLWAGPVPRRVPNCHGIVRKGVGPAVLGAPLHQCGA